MTQYIAKPNMNTDTGMKTFNVESDAIKYQRNTQGMRCPMREIVRQRKDK